MSDGTLLGDRKAAADVVRRKEGYRLVVEYLDAVEAELKVLRSFVDDILPLSKQADVSSEEIAIIGANHGLLIKSTVYEPCSPGCICDGMFCKAEFEAGVTCYCLKS